MNTWRPAHTLVVRIGPLTALPDDEELRDTVAQGVTELVAAMTAELGLPLAPHVQVVLDELPGLVVSSDDFALSAGDLDLEEAWRLVAPAEVRSVPFGWEWQRWASAVAPVADRRDAVAALAAEVTAELLRRRPDRLLTVRQAVAYLMRHEGTRTRRLDPDALRRAVAPILAQGVGIGDGPRVLTHLANGAPPADERIEAMIADLRAPGLDVLVAGDLAGRLDDAFTSTAEQLFADLGLRLPPVRLTVDELLPPGQLRVRVNSLSGRGYRGLPARTVMVDASPEELGDRAGPAAAARHPVTAARCAVVADRYVAALRADDRLTWSAPEHAALAVAAEVRRRAADLVDIRTVEYELALLHRELPALVVEALDVCSLPELADVARGLLRDGAGIRDLRTVLERLVSFHALPDAADRALLGGGALPPTAAADAPAWTPGEERAGFVRLGLGEELVARHAAGTGEVAAVIVHHDAADRLRQHRAHETGSATGRALSGPQLAHLAEVARGAGLRAGEGRPVVLLTAADVRGVLASLLADVAPDVAVVAFEELPPSAAVLPVADLSLPVEGAGG